MFSWKISFLVNKEYMIIQIVTCYFRAFYEIFLSNLGIVIIVIALLNDECITTIFKIW